MERPSEFGNENLRKIRSYLRSIFFLDGKEISTFLKMNAKRMHGSRAMINMSSCNSPSISRIEMFH
jgi:hypothetical protein